MKLAIIIPKKIPASVSPWVQRAILGILKLPDTYLIYYEPAVNRQRPDFVIISPELGILIVEIRSWKSSAITGISDEEIQIDEDFQRAEIHPSLHARLFLKQIAQDAGQHPLFSMFLSGEREAGLSIPTGYLLLLPNCTIAELSSHHLCDLHTFFNPEHTICRDMLREMERWDAEDLIPFLRSCLPPGNSQPALTDDQILCIRAILHPDTVISLKIPDKVNKEISVKQYLTLLDHEQEQAVYQIKSGHQIVYGQAGSGKTTLLVARAKLLHSHSDSATILLLCYNSLLSAHLERELAHYPRIHIRTFQAWAEEQGITRHPAGNDIESDEQFGQRLYHLLTSHLPESMRYDAICIDQGQDFPASWIQCALEALKEKESGDLLIVSDGEQGRYGPNGVRWADLGIHSRGRIIHQESGLYNTYRTTREILNVASLFGETTLQYGKLITESPHHTKNIERNGLKPLLIWNTSQAGQGEYATFLVKRLLGSLKSARHLAGLKPDDIAILYPFAENHDKKIISRMVQELSKFCPVQWVCENGCNHVLIQRHGVKIHDTHSIKGLQYRACIVLFTEYYDKLAKTHNLPSDKLLYIALTRPRDFLSIQYTEKTDHIRRILASGSVDQFIGK